MNILGVNAFHADSAAALIVDGQLVVAIEEERIRRIKHWAGFPSQAIAACLAEAGLSIQDLDVVAINQDSGAHRWKKMRYALLNRPDPKFILEKLRNKKKRSNVSAELAKAFPGENFGGDVRYVEHHLAHLSSAFHVSPFQKAIAVSVDGFGDFASGAWGLCEGTDISVSGRVFFPHSLGIFYQALTQFLGFPHYGDEYKIMGLAPYGRPSYLEELREIVKLQNDGKYRLNLDYFRHHREQISYEWDDGVPVFGELFSEALEGLLGPVRQSDEPLDQRHWDIAHSVQAMYEEAFFHLLDFLHKEHGVDDLALAGGCAMNSVANGKIYRRSPFKRAYIQSAAGDAGGAIGAALVAWHENNSSTNSRYQMEHAFWGPSYTNEEILTAIDNRRADLETQACDIEIISTDPELCDRAANAVAAGRVVGWFQGRMEWGPRALGNRSIIGDPRRADMKDILNLKIKRRESFRPFAPSILRDSVSDWFEEDDDVPFMMKVFQIRADKRSEIPAVTHVDGSGRLQTVSPDTNPRYHMLISSFGEKTGVPLVLNTSFNENEPVVCQPAEALDCFLRTNMDVLVLGDYFIQRRATEQPGVAAQSAI